MEGVVNLAATPTGGGHLADYFPIVGRLQRDDAQVGQQIVFNYPERLTGVNPRSQRGAGQGRVDFGHAVLGHPALVAAGLNQTERGESLRVVDVAGGGRRH